MRFLESVKILILKWCIAFNGAMLNFFFFSCWISWSVLDIINCVYLCKTLITGTQDNWLKSHVNLMVTDRKFLFQYNKERHCTQFHISLWFSTQHIGRYDELSWRVEWRSSKSPVVSVNPQTHISTRWTSASEKWKPV